MTLTYDTNGFREIAHNQSHARTEYRTAEGRTFSTNGTGEEVRALLVRHAENVGGLNIDREG